MPALVTSASSLGTAAEGTIKGVKLPSGHVEWMVYDATDQLWRGRTHLTMRTVSQYGQQASGAESAWRYPAGFRENPGYLYGPGVAIGFQIHKIPEGGRFWASGLKMQECLSAHFRMIGPEVGLDPKISLAWYPLAQGEGFLSPAPFNFGVELVGSRDRDVPHWTTTGWQPTPTFATPPDADDILYPEIYLTGPVANFRQFSAFRRWVYGPGTATAASITPSKFPASNLLGWWDAKTIPVADNAAVASWTDYSGCGANLAQSDPTKRPVVMTASGRRFVRFDGVNDRLGVTGVGTIQDITTNSAAPITVFLVLRQTTGGAATQMWLQSDGNSPMMIYHGNTSGQINSWNGAGSDSTATGSGWGNWFVYSLKLTAAPVVTIWENTTPLTVSGGGGTAGFNGFSMGSASNDTSPASIDVAECIVSWRDIDNTERTNIINALRAKHSV